MTHPVHVAASGAEPKWLGWTRLLGRYAVFQSACQAFAILSGVLIVRALPVPEYASYTIVFAFMSAAAVLADSGTTNAVSAVGGRVCTDPPRMARLVSTAVNFRRRLELILLVLTLPLLAAALHEKSASITRVAVAVTVAAAVIHCQVGSGVMLVVLRLQLRLEELQRVQLLVVMTKLTLIALAVVLVPRVEWMLLATGASVVVERLLLERRVYSTLERAAPEEPSDAVAVRSAFRHQFISAAYVAFQSQITVWLLSLYGGRNSIAEIGALGRLSLMFSVVSAVLSNVIFPRFARCADPTQLRRRYFQILAGITALGLGVVLFAGLLPGPLLWVLGHQYEHLERELLLMMGSSVCYLLANTIWGLNASRGWIRGSWLYAPLTLAMQAMLFWSMDVSTVHSAILFGWYSLLPAFLINVALAFRGFRGFGGLVVTDEEGGHFGRARS